MAIRRRPFMNNELIHFVAKAIAHSEKDWEMWEAYTGSAIAAIEAVENFQKNQLIDDDLPDLRQICSCGQQGCEEH